ncbi:hypothetical protein N0V95_007877 [Ascochyta clinopodiicola]|nr:hypothetical protein N0V95_007877 [Ascochyta clinopodiicola]
MVDEFDGAPYYEYEPLDLTRHQICLIKLEAGSLSQTIHCDISTFDLIDAPSYMALSYTWGSSDPIHAIWVKRRRFNARENLFHFLLEFRPSDEDAIHIWIDQLCIDQCSAAERNHQVAQMQCIYQRSLLVIAWLGHEESDVKAAQTFQDGGDVKELEVLLFNTYFTRIWIIQELLLAPEVLLLCGSVLISGLDMKELAETCSWSELPNVPLALFAEGCASLDTWAHPLDILETIINRYSGNDCADPRDKVYGLLGLARVQDIQGRTLLTVDYEKHVHEIFTDTVFAISSRHVRDFDTVKHVWRSKSFLYFAQDLGHNMGISRHYLNRVGSLLEAWLIDGIELPALVLSETGNKIKALFNEPMPLSLR